MREMTPAPSIEPSTDVDEPMPDNFEFSDVEIEEPMPKRTRSQSRMKETSLPAAEPAPKQTKVRRGAKKVDADAAAKKPRRRRVITEEPIDLMNTDDEWTIFNFTFISFLSYFLNNYVFRCVIDIWYLNE